MPPRHQPVGRDRAASGPDPGVDDAVPTLDGRTILGRTMLTGGVLLVLFAVFQVWGTAAVAWHAQRSLNTELENDLAASSSPVEAPARQQLGHMAFDATTSESAAAMADATPEPGAATPSPVPSPVSVVAPTPTLTAGQPIGRIDLPTIGATRAVVFGVGRDDLRRGPGLYPSSPLPGHQGNTAIAGHRTTHGAPFADLDLLQPGDPIVVETVEGRFAYEVRGHEQPDGSVLGHAIVAPDAVGVLSDHDDDRLTLTACHPKYSAQQRIVVTATLVDTPLPLAPVVSAAGAAAAAAPTPIAHGSSQVEDAAVVGGATGSPAEALGWQAAAIEPTVLWATINLQIAHAGWVLGRLWRRRPARVITGLTLVVPLFTFYLHLDRLLPAL